MRKPNDNSKQLATVNSLIKVVSCYHVNIKLVETAEWRLGDGPKRENEANSGEGALASGQRAHVTQVGLVSLAWLHLQKNGGHIRSISF